MSNYRKITNSYCSSQFIFSEIGLITLYFDLSLFLLITFRRRSFGLDNVFTLVCHSVHGGLASQHASQGVLHLGDLHPVGGLHPGESTSRGMHPGGSVSRG